jgi:TP901-1 family phage major tail protein
MAGQRGRDILLKLADETGTFITVAGIRTKTLLLNAGTVDGTNTDSPEAWRELVSGAGVKSARLSGAGVFKDKASDARIREIFFAGNVAAWCLIVPDFGEIQGPFQISELAYSGDHDGEATFTLTLESAGALTFRGLS